MDILQITILASVLAFIVIAYAVRLSVRGPARYERIDRQGGTALLPKETLQMGYWAIQPLATLLIRLHLTPRSLTWSSLVFGLSAGLSLASGRFGWGALLATVSAVLDALDGLVARKTGSASASGAVLDSSIDRYVEFFFLAGLIYHYRGLPGLQLLALFALLGSFMVSYSSAKAEALQVQLLKGLMRRPEREVYLILGVALSPLSILWFGFEYPLTIALGLVAALANFSAIARLTKLARIADQRTKSPARPWSPPASTLDRHGKGRG